MIFHNRLTSPELGAAAPRIASSNIPTASLDYCPREPTWQEIAPAESEELGLRLEALGLRDEDGIGIRLGALTQVKEFGLDF